MVTDAWTCAHLKQCSGSVSRSSGSSTGCVAALGGGVLTGGVCVSLKRTLG